MAVISLADEYHYFEAMSGNDSFTVIIRGVAYLDYELQKLLAVSVNEPSYIDDMNLDYSGRCKLAFALGLDPKFKPALTAVGGLRNKLAHDPARSLTQADASDLFGKLPASAARQIPEILKTRVISPKVEKFGQLDTLDQYVLMLVMIRAAVIAARHLIENGSARG